MENIIYTRDEAARIMEMFENLLEDNGIKLPSPEDCDREDDNEAALYGSTYYGLLDSVESLLAEALDKHSNGFIVVTDRFSGNF